LEWSQHLDIEKIKALVKEGAKEKVIANLEAKEKEEAKDKEGVKDEGKEKELHLLKEQEVVKELELVEKKWSVKKGLWGKGKHEKTVVISYAGVFKEKKILEYLSNLKFTILK
jgi:hypothetical protein